MSTLQRDLRASLGDGAFYSLMVGTGETYLAAFALSLRAGEIATGLLIAVPMLAGALLQLAAPVLLKHVGSQRKWVVSCAICQALSLLMLPLAIPAGGWAIALLYLAASLYWGTGQATGPAWNSWIEELVPRELRARFFAQRSRISQLCVLVGFVGGGLFLEYGQRRDFPLVAFTILLATAALCRLVSAYCLSRHSEPQATLGASDQVGVRQVLRDLRGHEGAKLCWYLFAVQIAVQISGPFFAPFMLAQLKMSYAQFMVLVALGFVGKVLGLPLWGKVAQRYGARVLMWIGGISIAPVTGMWLGLPWFDSPMVYLAAIQIIGGVAWAAYELAFFLMFFETIPRQERISVLTLYNVGYSLATALGAVLGAFALATLGEVPRSYLLLFGLSSICRVLALGLLARVPKMQIEVVVPALRILSLRSSDDVSLDRPVLQTIPQRRESPPRQALPAAKLHQEKRKDLGETSLAASMSSDTEVRAAASRNAEISDDSENRRALNSIL